MFITLEFARLVKAKTYRDVVTGIYWDNAIVGKVMLLVWDLVQLFSIVVTSGSCISGSGTVLQQALGINYTLGMVLFVVVILVVVLLCAATLIGRLGLMTIVQAGYGKALHLLQL